MVHMKQTARCSKIASMADIHQISILSWFSMCTYMHRLAAQLGKHPIISIPFRLIKMKVGYVVDNRVRKSRVYLA